EVEPERLALAPLAPFPREVSRRPPALARRTLARCRAPRRRRRRWKDLCSCTLRWGVGSLRRRLVEQHKSSGDARCRNRRIRFRLVLTLHIESADIDDAGELSDTVEKRREVVVRALGLQRNRPLGVQLFRHGRRGLETHDRQVRLSGDGLKPSEQVGGGFFGGQHGLQGFERPFGVRDVRLKRRKPFRGFVTLRNVGFECLQLGLARRDVCARRLLVVVVERADARAREDRERANLRVPRQLCETDVHRNRYSAVREIFDAFYVRQLQTSANLSVSWLSTLCPRSIRAVLALTPPLAVEIAL